MTLQTPSENSSRYGIYFAPAADSPLYRYGNTWLGRDVIEGNDLDPVLPDLISHDSWLVATESPRRYGFHATLKPPFRLADGASLDDLRRALHELCANHAAFDMPTLQVSQLGHFLALTLSRPSEQLNDLANTCVSALDRFRSNPSEAEHTSRLKSSLSEHEREHVLCWGYPYVFDTWKFHMTLSSSLKPDEIKFFLPYLEDRFAPVCEHSVRVDSVCIFHEPMPGAPFRLIDRALLRPQHA